MSLATSQQQTHATANEVEAHFCPQRQITNCAVSVFALIRIQVRKHKFTNNKALMKIFYNACALLEHRRFVSNNFVTLFTFLDARNEIVCAGNNGK